MCWTNKQINTFINDPSIGPDAVYADKIIRPMARVFCPEALVKFDESWNIGDEPLGPNWHTFASELEVFVKESHLKNNSKKLHNYYSFLNWALYEKTSYLHREAFISPFEGIIELNPKDWMPYLPKVILEEMIDFMSTYMSSHTIRQMQKELQVLLKNPVLHAQYWMPCHRSFTEVAQQKSIPYTNQLPD